MAYSEPDWLNDSSAAFHGDEALCGWHPPIKIASLLIFCFISALLTTILAAATAGFIALVAMLFHKVRPQGALRRIGALLGFLMMLLVVLPFTIQERLADHIMQWSVLPFLSFNARGLLLALLIALKAMVIALVVESLLAKTSFSVIVQALAQLKVPGKICQLLLLTHRYIFVLQQEARRMYNAMGLRGFRIAANFDTFKIMGNFLGMLFVRSYERTQRVYEAMVMRGYRGVLPQYHQFKARPADWVLGGFWCILGSVLLFLDRL